MNNRVLRRQLKKFVQINTKEDLDVLFNFIVSSVATADTIPQVVPHFIDGFYDFFQALDHGYSEYDRVLNAREVSIEINETEVNRFHGLLQQELATRDVVLKQLRVILNSMNSTQSTEETEELVVLVAKVETLVKNHIERSKDLEIVFRESLKLARSQNFPELGCQLRDCVKSLVIENLDIQIYFNIAKLQMKEGAGFVRLTEAGEIDLKRIYSLTEINVNPANCVGIDEAEDANPSFIITIFSPLQTAWVIPIIVQQILKALTSSILSSIEFIQNIQRENAKQRMELELNTARLIQQTLIPQDLITVNNEILLASWYQTASECGGDWWGNYQLKDGRHLILIGDVTGHGMGSALLTAVVKGYCDGIETRDYFNIRDFFVELNSQIVKVAESKKWMSMLAIAYTPATQSLEIVNAGHPFPIIINDIKEKHFAYIAPLKLPGPMLGQVAECLGIDDFESLTLQMKSGDKLCMFTDGLTETFSGDNREFSEARLMRIIQSIETNSSAIHFRDFIRKHNENFRGNAPLQDDISVVIAEFL